MPQENVDVVRGLLERFRGGASEAYRAGAYPFEEFHPNVDWDASEVALPDLGGTRDRGRMAIRRFWQEWLAAWEAIDFRYELVEAGDSVVALIEQRMRARSTSIELDIPPYAQVFTLEGGLIVHWKLYTSQRRALEAVGLRE